ncbi:MAG: hypothetical protein R6U96_08370 [Promethearchaeia archaeon]
MTIIEEKSGYPYITTFKKAPFKSFSLIKDRKIGSFFFSAYDQLDEFYEYFKKNLLDDKSLTLKKVYWFLLLGKYFKQNFAKTEELYKFIQSCQYELKDGRIGFKENPASPKKYPNVRSTYYALVSMKILGVLKEYLQSKGKGRVPSEIKRFIISHQKKNIFIHCKNKDCEICGGFPPEKTLFFIIEIFSLLKTDIRIQQSKFLNFISKTTEDYSVNFKLLCLNYLGLNSKVKREDLEYLNGQQKEDGGYNFSEERSTINETFWTVYTLHTFSWFFDYNPAGIYAYINSHLTKILANKDNWSPRKIQDISKLIIILSLIWEKFIDEIERAIFKELEDKTFLDLNKITCLFGLSDVMEDIVSYINLNYVFNLRIINNEHKFHNYIKGLNAKEQIVAKAVYNSLRENSVISISDIVSEHKSDFPVEELKVKDVIELIDDMKEEHFFKGKIRTKRKYLIKKKYYFYLDTFIEKLIISDTKINLERLEEEKEKLKEIENDIFNMRLKLKKTSNQIKEEVKSYLILNEIDLAKQRLRFILRDALMNADFLNENIENNFNVDLYYINIRARLSTEIKKWQKEYSRLKQKLKNIDQDLQVEIAEKEELRKLNFKLEKLDEKIFQTGNYYNKRINDFRKYLRETLQDGYTEDKFSLIKREFRSIKDSVEKFDQKIFDFSKNISTEEEVILKKHREVINNWISIKEEMSEVFEYYEHGFQFFEDYLEKLEQIKQRINRDIKNIEDKIADSIQEKEFQEAFEIIKKQSEEQLKEKSKEIKKIQKAVDKELTKNQKLFLLYRHLQNKSDQIEENLIDLIEEPVSDLRSKVIKKRNKVKIKNFEDFISENASTYRSKIQNYKEELSDPQIIKNLEISDIEDDLEELKEDFQEIDEQFEEKLEACNELVKDFNEKLKVSIIKWKKFKEFFYDELENVRDEFINSIISAKINKLINRTKTNSILIKDLKKSVNLKCKILVKRIKDMIDMSKLEGELDEKENYLLVYTEQYFKIKKLNNYVENSLLKKNYESVGKILALYDSAIKHKTLKINLSELQDRINELSDFDKEMMKKFNEKVRSLGIDQTLKDFKEIKQNFGSRINKDAQALMDIKKNLKLFSDLQSFIISRYNNAKLELREFETSIEKKINKTESYEKVNAYFTKKREKFENRLENIEDEIDEKIKKSIDDDFKSENLDAELREIYVNNKNHFFKEYEEKKDKLRDKINILKHEDLREKLLNYINERKIFFSQLLGTLQKRVKEYIEIREFKKANNKIRKRKENILDLIGEAKKEIKNLNKRYSKKAKNFETKNKYLFEDFDKFLKEFGETVEEKAKNLHRMILKSYVEMSIKAVANGFLTISFINNELKIKKKRIQDYLIYLIGSDQLPGKYDPRLGIYYEDPRVLENINEEELQVIKKMNYKVYMFLTRLKNFTTQYSSIIAFFASTLTITYYSFVLTGENPMVAAIPLLFITFVIAYLMFKKREKEKV